MSKGAVLLAVLATLAGCGGLPRVVAESKAQVRAMAHAWHEGQKQPSGTVRVQRGDKELPAGSLQAALEMSEDGDRILLSRGKFATGDLRLPAKRVVVSGQGPETVLLGTGEFWEGEPPRMTARMGVDYLKHLGSRVAFHALSVVNLFAEEPASDEADAALWLVDCDVYGMRIRHKVRVIGVGGRVLSDDGKPVLDGGSVGTITFMYTKSEDSGRWHATSFSHWGAGLTSPKTQMEIPGDLLADDAFSRGLPGPERPAGKVIDAPAQVKELTPFEKHTLTLVVAFVRGEPIPTLDSSSDAEWVASYTARKSFEEHSRRSEEAYRRQEESRARMEALARQREMEYRREVWERERREREAKNPAAPPKDVAPPPAAPQPVSARQMLLDAKRQAMNDAWSQWTRSGDARDGEKYRRAADDYRRYGGE